MATRSESAEFRSAFVAHLRPHAPRLTKVLSKCVEHPYPEGFRQLDSENHALDHGFPVRVHCYREDL